MTASKTATASGPSENSIPGAPQGGVRGPMPSMKDGWAHSGSELAGLEDLIHEFEDRIARLGNLDASHVRLVLQDGLLVLTGSVNSKDERRRVGACAVSVAQDLPVSNRVKIIPSL